jgi:hypothetical protein
MWIHVMRKNSGCLWCRGPGEHLRSFCLHGSWWRQDRTCGHRTSLGRITY